MKPLPYRPCVGICLINAQGLVFAGQRKDGPASAWQMPQGGVERGEKPRPAALRELVEETGVAEDLVEVVAKTSGLMTYDLPEDIQPKIWGGKYRGQRQKWFLMRYLGTDAQINIATKHPEFAAWQWMKAAAVLDTIVPFKRDVYAQVFAAFGKHLAQ